MARVAEAEDALLGPALLLVTPRTAERGIVATGVEGLLEGLGLHDVRVALRAVVERVDLVSLSLGVDPLDQLDTDVLGQLVAEADHLPELERGVHVQQREGDLAGMECLLRQTQHDSAVLADRVEHHRLVTLGGHFADDLDALVLELLQVAE